jgi:hypothetical protein
MNPGYLEGADMPYPATNEDTRAVTNLKMPLKGMYAQPGA